MFDWYVLGVESYLLSFGARMSIGRFPVMFGLNHPKKGDMNPAKLQE